MLGGVGHGKGMNIVRFRDKAGWVHHGAEQPDGTVRRIDGDIFGAYAVTDQVAEVAKLLAPIAPTQILCVGLNYRKHAEETKAPVPVHPILFLKGLNTVQNPGDPIELPVHLPSTKVDYEGELAVVIGRDCKNATPETALSFVLGYTCGNDVSARDWQKQGGGGQWCRGKGFDTFAPLGPRLVTADEIGDPGTLGLRTRVNGETLQDWHTGDMIFDVPTLITFLSGSTTLPAGTVILTGTPHGVGLARTPPRWLQPGDVVEVEIDRIGTLRNPVGLETV